MKKYIFMMIATISSATAMAQSSKDTASIRQVVTTIEQGWNTKKSEIFASVFAEVHDYIVVNGFYFKDFTRQANASVHQGLFDGVYRNNNIKLKIDKIQFLRPDLAITTVIGANYVIEAGVPADPTAIMTIITEKKNNEWKITYFHNHSLAEAFESKGNHPPFQVMYASWYRN